MADALKAELGVETQLVPGDRGVFVVSVDDTVVAKKTIDGFPDPADVVEAVRAAL